MADQWGHSVPARRGDAIAFDGKLFYEIRGYAPGRNLEGRGRGHEPVGNLFRLFRML